MLRFFTVTHTHTHKHKQLSRLSRGSCFHSDAHERPHTGAHNYCNYQACNVVPAPSSSLQATSPTIHSSKQKKKTVTRTQSFLPTPVGSCPVKQHDHRETRGAYTFLPAKKRRKETKTHTTAGATVCFGVARALGKKRFLARGGCFASYREQHVCPRDLCSRRKDTTHSLSHTDTLGVVGLSYARL